MVDPSEPLENLYFEWLCAKVMYLPHPTRSLTFYNLLRKLHRTEFAWILDRDDNRAADGKELRREFILLGNFPDDLEWRHLVPCSVLEMLIAFSKRAEFQTSDPSSQWFWEMVDNLGLTKFNDSVPFFVTEVEDILDMFIWRTYDENGNGGLFPLSGRTLKWTGGRTRDQRKAEIFYQFCDYLQDQDRMP